MKANLRPRCGDSSSSRLSATKGGVEKGTNKPKRPTGAFFLFMKGFRESFKEGHPHIKVPGPRASRAGAKVWKTMTDAEKAPHRTKAAGLNAEYTKQMEIYKKSQNDEVSVEEDDRGESDEVDDHGESDEEDDSGDESDEEDSCGDSSLSAKKSKAEKGPDKPKRPLTAFFVFMKEFRKDYKEKYPHIKSECLVCEAGGDVWKSLSDDEKFPHVDKANKLMLEYKEKVRVYNNRQESQRRPATLDKSKSKDDLQAGVPEVPSDSDKSKSAGRPEAPGDSDKSKSKSHLQAGGLKAPDDSDKSKSKSHLQAGGPVAPGDSDKSKSGSIREDDGSVVRAVRPPEASVLGGNGGRPQRRRGPAYRLLGVARKMMKTRKITGCRRMVVSS